ncbi:putative Zn-binding protein involved in type VI secretion [Pararhizobium capsulatum DSM 1112]|uniref:Zn-binding protein involved in type VI secretion n=1 Tax=Pararhizobium capsulatum DSM 1112 TaxID=1121113 RepID=A0ABU0BRZ2_9HYPH|nr:hypothetical protein [Pararhizobium capsulatum]MDQ0321010.1 putative Zn-binding protein involved in type VI secretion [Pararhizobium capsulatum DSM 1112]
MLTRIVACTGLLLAGTSAAAFAEEGATSTIPPCALSGAVSVMIGGAPALRLSDVAKCPPELYEIVPSIMIEGQPVVHFRGGSDGKTSCGAKSEGSVMMEGEAANRLGDVACKTQ